MRENYDQKKSKYRHVLHIVKPVFFVKRGYRLKAVNFSQKAPSEIFDWFLKTAHLLFLKFFH